MKRVFFVPRMGIERAFGKIDEILISIVDSDIDEVELRGDWRAVIRLQFDDIDRPFPGLILFNKDHARDIIAFLELWKDVEDMTFYVQCSAGISRSAAVAKFVADYFDIKQFNHRYMLYNKYVYALLMETHYGSVYDFVRGKFDKKEED